MDNKIDLGGGGSGGDELNDDFSLVGLRGLVGELVAASRNVPV